MDGEVLKLFGLDIETLLMISGVVFVVIEALKKKFAAMFMGGWKTDLVALILSAGMAYKIYAPDWETVAIGAVICWLAPSALHKKTNGKG